MASKGENFVTMHRPKKHLNFGSLVQAFRHHCDDLLDSRQKSKINYSLSDIVLSSFACMFFQDRSLLQFQRRMEKEEELSNVSNLFGVSKIPEDTQLRKVMDNLSCDNFRALFKEYFSRLQRSKHLEPFRFFGQKYLVSLDGTQYFSSKEISCSHCLTKEHKTGEKTYSHQALQGAIVHPTHRQVIPLMAEDIRNEDGKKKQDCEINAAKRFIPSLRKDHPKLEVIVLGDGLFSKNPMVELVRENQMDFIFVAKPDDHKFMMQDIASREENEIQELVIEKDKGEIFTYRWVKDVPLNASEEAFSVNYFELSIQRPNKQGELKRTYLCSWVTNLSIYRNNIEHMVQGSRCRWKIENECFNTLKNQGYCLEHNFGHGSQNLAFNFYLLTLLAFFYHQIFELTDHLYQTARAKWSKFLLWEKLRTLINYIYFKSWEQLLSFCLDPPELNADNLILSNTSNT